MQISTIDSISQAKNFCYENFTDKNPFISYDFFELLEDTHCTVEAKGWIPEHIVIKDKDLNVRRSLVNNNIVSMFNNEILVA